MFNYLIRGCTVADGIRPDPYKADIGISGDETAFIGDASDYSADVEIDGNGLHVLPGFIDIHSHSDLDVLFNPREFNKVSQGVTTECCGNCGYSLFPVTQPARKAITAAAAAFNRPYEFEWTDGRGFFSMVESLEPGFNYIPLAGHGFLRINAAGFNAAPAGEAEISLMKELLAKEMENGCFGFSTGLEYMPGCFADAAEIEELCKVSAAYGGVYTTHLRNQGRLLIENVTEAVSYAEKTGVSVIISHLKAYGKNNWGKAYEALEIISSARKSGLKVMADFYPYDHSSTTLDYILPPWAKDGGPDAVRKRLSSGAERGKILKDMEDNGEIDWDRIFICGASLKENSDLIGLSVSEAAAKRKEECAALVFDLIIQEGIGVETVSAMMDQDEVDYIASHPCTSVGSDSYALGTAAPFTGHPRNYGTFPRFFKRYVSDMKTVTLGEAVQKTSASAAEFLGLKDRGVIRHGSKADLVILDLNRTEDKATYREPGLVSSGIEAVFVNGKLQFTNGKLQGSGAGTVLRRN